MSASMGTQALNSAISALDRGGKYANVTYHLTSRNSLTQTSPWWIFMPGTWTASQSLSPSPLQQALLNAMQVTPQGDFFLDITYLADQVPNTSLDFFFDKDSQQKVAVALAKLINGFPRDKKLIIRYLVGGPWDIWEPIADGFVLAMIEAGVQNPNASLYFGNFSPSFDLSLSPQAGQGEELPQSIWDKIIQLIERILKDLYEIFEDIEGSTLVQWLIQYFEAIGLTTGCWNHGKIFALSGDTLVTGGANYWPPYASGKTWLFDSSMTIQGEAVGDAHAFANYQWTYLNGLPETDPRYPQGAYLAFPYKFSPRKAPMHTGQPKPKGNLRALSVGKNGFLPEDDLPAQLVDAARDFFVNLAIARIEAQDNDPARIANVLDAVDDENPMFQGFVDAIGISPACWASRFSKNYAVKNAQKTVRLTQQTLVMSDVQSVLKKSGLLTAINDALGCNWDGIVRPWDLYAAFASAIATLSGTTPVEKPPVQIVCSTTNNEGGYQDSTDVGQFKNQLAQVMNGLKAIGKIHFQGDALTLVNRLVGYKRISVDTPPSHGNHSKVFVIDDSVMYVGSDNAYPSYNTEFGLWIDDLPSIQNYISGYWSGTPGLWNFAKPVS
jgi:hypothetical protein